MKDGTGILDWGLFVQESEGAIASIEFEIYLGISSSRETCWRKYLLISLGRRIHEGWSGFCSETTSTNSFNV